MKDGFWLNYYTGDVFLITEHEQWLRAGDNARKLGLSGELRAAFSRFEPQRDRNAFLLFVMRKAPVMRIRGHGVSVTFEFADADWSAPAQAIREWGFKYAGAVTNLRITNFATAECVVMQWQEFQKTTKNAQDLTSASLQSRRET